ncbi:MULTISPECIES: trehalose-phosphatase [unclassified Roseovarius]|uniref:trehalose-phosphatase n=1 Tax=unclassified Roseovarius TaxID=2614913 RepID=UPI00273EB06A|nr:trehalose-phosphatase [Roseovarius sp. MMSF_3350]
MTQLSELHDASDGAHPPDIDWRLSAAFLDFDGTLAPLEQHPDDVRLPDRERRLVNRLSDLTGGAVAILTGRDLSNIRGFFKDMPVVLSGSHGAEIEGHDSPLLRPDAQAELTRCHDAVRGYAEKYGLLVEKKAAAVAVHYREKPDMQQAVTAFVSDLAETSSALKPLHGNMVSELTLRDVDKGTALLRLMEHGAFQGRIPVSVGDDTTDEDTFRAARSLGGVGLRIATRTLAETAAEHVFATRTDFVDWLEHSLEQETEAG